jgi:hypothetical protein
MRATAVLVSAQTKEREFIPRLQNLLAVENRHRNDSIRMDPVNSGGTEAAVRDDVDTDRFMTRTGDDQPVANLDERYQMGMPTMQAKPRAFDGIPYSPKLARSNHQAISTHSMRLYHGTGCHIHACSLHRSSPAAMLIAQRLFPLRTRHKTPVAQRRNTHDATPSRRLAQYMARGKPFAL